MNTLASIYNTGFFKQRYKLSHRAPFVCTVIVKCLAPKSVIDIGCAIGDLVKGFQDLGIDAKGLEGSETAEPYLAVRRESVVFTDLRTPLPVDIGKFDLVTCFEVFEHIEPEYADQLCANMSVLSDRLLISAAPPGQGGHYHVNCQLPDYWDEKLKKYGYNRDMVIEALIKEKLRPKEGVEGIKAIYQNLLYYRREND